MELEEAISKLKYELDKSKIVKKYQGKPEELFDDLDEYIKSIETVLNHLTKQEKIINQMAEDRMLPHGCRTLYNVFNKQDVIDFYEKFVEESE